MRVTVSAERLRDLMHMIEHARAVFAHLPNDARAALPPDAQRALTAFYDLDDYKAQGGGIAPPDAPHLPGGGSEL